MKLHSVKGYDPKRRVWCGPGALAIITGRSYDLMLERIKEKRGNNDAVKGTSPWELRSVLDDVGYNTLMFQCSKAGHRPTLAKWLRMRERHMVNEMFLVQLTGHWVVIKGRKACDNQCKDPVFISKFRHRRKRVEHAYVIRKR